jgi:3-deoxy-manno-octulosonate cytidylyltransferase (CMP-KDO synthetase)
VKCVRAADGRALYFSRGLVPYDRDRAAEAARPMKHVGLYVYRREFLRTFAALAPTPLERTESLEQLRVLEHGHSILCAEGEAHFTGIDTPEQYAAFVERMRGRR